MACVKSRASKKYETDEIPPFRAVWTDELEANEGYLKRKKKRNKCNARM